MSNPKASVAHSEEHSLTGRHLWHGFERTLNKYAFAGRFVQGKSCLDIACGIGYGSNYLASRGATFVIGGDIADEAVGYARGRYASQRTLRFMVLDAHHLPFPDETFEVVVSIETIEHLQQPQRFLDECPRVLILGGTLICSTPNKVMASPCTRAPLCQWHTKEFELEELRLLVKGHFGEVAVYGQFYRKDLGWRFDVIAGQFVGPLIRCFPMGDWLAHFLNRLVRGRKPVQLSELDDRIWQARDDVLPYPQPGKEIGSIVLVATK